MPFTLMFKNGTQRRSSAQTTHRSAKLPIHSHTLTRCRGCHPKGRHCSMSFTLMFKNGTQRYSSRRMTQCCSNTHCHSHSTTCRRGCHPKGRHCFMPFTLMFKNGTQRRSNRRSTQRCSNPRSHSHIQTRSRGDHPKGRHRLMSFTLFFYDAVPLAHNVDCFLLYGGAGFPQTPSRQRRRLFTRKGRNDARVDVRHSVVQIHTATATVRPVAAVATRKGVAVHRIVVPVIITCVRAF